MSDKKSFKDFLKSIHWIRFTVITLLSIILVLVISIWFYPGYRDRKILEDFDSTDASVRFGAIAKMVQLAKKYPDSLKRVRSLLDSESDEKFQSAYFVLREIGNINREFLSSKYKTRMDCVDLIYYKQTHEPKLEIYSKKLHPSLIDSSAKNWSAPLVRILLSGEDNKYVRKALAIAANSPYRVMRATATTLAARLGEKETLIKLAQDPEIAVQRNALKDILLTNFASDKRVAKACKLVLKKYTPILIKNYPAYKAAIDNFKKDEREHYARIEKIKELKEKLLRQNNKKTGNYALPKKEDYPQELKSLEFSVSFYKDTAMSRHAKLTSQTKAYNSYREMIVCAFSCLTKSEKLSLKDFPVDPKNIDLDIYTMIFASCDFKALCDFEKQTTEPTILNALKLIKLCRQKQNQAINPSASKNYIAAKPVTYNLANKEDIFEDSEIARAKRQEVLYYLMLANQNHNQNHNLKNLGDFLRKNYDIGYPKIFSEAIIAYGSLLRKSKTIKRSHDTGDQLLYLLSSKIYNKNGKDFSVDPFPAATAAVELWKLNPRTTISPDIDIDSEYIYNGYSIANIESVLYEPSGLARDIICWQLANLDSPNVKKLIYNLTNPKDKSLITKNLSYFANQLETYYQKLHNKPATNIKKLELLLKNAGSNKIRSLYATMLQTANQSETRTMIGMLKLFEVYCPRTPACALLISQSPAFYTKFLWGAYPSLGSCSQIITHMQLQDVISKFAPSLPTPTPEVGSSTQVFQCDLLRRAYLIYPKYYDVSYRKENR